MRVSPWLREWLHADEELHGEAATQGQGGARESWGRAEEWGGRTLLCWMWMEGAGVERSHDPAETAGVGVIPEDCRTMGLAFRGEAWGPRFGQVLPGWG